MKMSRKAPFSKTSKALSFSFYSALIHLLFISIDGKHLCQCIKFFFHHYQKILINFYVLSKCIYPSCAGLKCNNSFKVFLSCGQCSKKIQTTFHLTYVLLICL